MRRPTQVGVVAAVTLLVAGCSGSTPTDGGSTSASTTRATSRATSGSASTSRPSTSSRHSTSSRISSTSTPRPAQTAGSPAAVLKRLSLPQRVGQLFMVGGPATGMGSPTLRAITERHIGNVMLTGRSSAGVAATRRVVDGAQNRVSAGSTGGVPLLVATDQEGGFVQVLRGPGFSDIPTGLVQGGWSSSRLQQRARGWGAELGAAGVALDLAPVADTVPKGFAARNPPIGRFRREFGDTATGVGDHAAAFVRGMAAAGVGTAAKHFPGLGRVTGNTDTTAGVTDRVTTARDPYLAPFAAAVRAGTPFVMLSTADYARIDPGTPAAFSPAVVRLLRGDLGFGGVVISDDLGSARQVARWSPGDRAVLFVRAGGDMVLTVDPSVLPAMYDAVLARARSDAAFRERVDASALRVLQGKARLGVLRG